MDQTRPNKWQVCGYAMDKSQVVYFSQIILIYLIIITCIINLSLRNADSNLWTALLSSCIGYILPSPKYKDKKNKKATDNDSSL